ncbi:uncharacterized protein LOC117648294 isoform X2 [Thrips palmi]|uniref:Uncharacterized protein LOC117648294 isoform X2 n=1 Tax=Thrips palmi TaxID=161013 RepID=A0A6P8Z2D0_THRPL|nr:uncharacterized protein LOC117648294 isoform X2 [Thrips palmi]
MLLMLLLLVYEARHFSFKLIATVAHNHHNSLMTLMDMLQMKLAADKQEQKSYITVGKQGTKLISVTSSMHCEELKKAGLELEKVGTHPRFSRIEAIYVSSNQETVYLITKQWKTLRFDAKFCAFEVQPGDNAGNNVKQPEHLAAYRPLALWKRYDSNKLYLAPRTVSE